MGGGGEGVGEGGAFLGRGEGESVLNFLRVNFFT